MPASVSACIITRDEEERLPACLDSVAFCDEIVVVDSGSEDATVEVARAAGARVVVNPWPGFAAQRNVALDHASGEWILEIDADERITRELRREIEAFLDDPPGVDMAALPRREIFLGGRLGPSAKYPEYRYRLFRRDAYRHDEARSVHEGLWTHGRTWPFDGDLEHVLAGSLREAVRDARAYANLEARHFAAPAAPSAYLVGGVVRPAAKLGYRLVVDGGWRDGWRGVVKIALDCASDAGVWAIQLRRPDREGGTGEHFGQRDPRLGSVRIVAVAAGAGAAQRAAAWLRGIQAAGGDGALITDAPPPPDRELHVRAVERVSPLRVIRALEAEHQLRPIDALACAPGRAGRILPLIPGRLRGGAGAIELGGDPAEAERRVRAATRG
jgi:hypothetical protein